MSNSRQRAIRVRSYSITHPPGLVSLPTQPGWDRLVFAQAGLFTAHTESRAWTIPAHRALCVPDGTGIRVQTTRRAAIRCLYFDAELALLDGKVRAVNLSSLTSELALRAVARAPMDLATRVDAALITLLAEELAGEPDASLHLPFPVDLTALLVATAIAADPTLGLDDHLRDVGASRRSVERRFKTETQMSLGQWRRRARILAGVAMLSEGENVTTVATRVGYSSPSSFVAAFRSELDAPPREFMRG